jgi:hypothetical protein
MTHVTYRIVAHDGGFAYRVGDTISETYPSRETAHAAAVAAAAEQTASGEGMTILYETTDGEWRHEDVSGRDRPDTEVRD